MIVYLYLIKTSYYNKSNIKGLLAIKSLAVWQCLKKYFFLFFLFSNIKIIFLKKIILNIFFYKKTSQYPKLYDLFYASSMPIRTTKTRTA